MIHHGSMGPSCRFAEDGHRRPVDRCQGASDEWSMDLHRKSMEIRSPANLSKSRPWVEEDGSFFVAVVLHHFDPKKNLTLVSNDLWISN